MTGAQDSPGSSRRCPWLLALKARSRPPELIGRGLVRVDVVERRLDRLLQCAISSASAASGDCAAVKARGRQALATLRLQRLPLCSLPLQEDCLWKLTFATNLERSEVFVPRALRRLRLRFAPQFQRIKVVRRYLPIRDPIEQVLPENRWKIGPPNLRHQSPNVIRASSSFKRCRSAASRDSVSRFTSEKKRSFSASLE